MKAIFKSTIILLLTSFFSSCSSSSEVDYNSPVSEAKRVIMVGRLADETGLIRATLWENGNPVFLSNENSTVSDVEVSNNNVFVSINETDTGVAKILKNGIPIFETDGSIYTQIQSVYIKGDDVYACGYLSDDRIRSAATYWINGNQYMLDPFTGNSKAQMILVKDNDIYICGNKGQGYYMRPKAVIWKNTQPTFLNTENYNSVTFKMKFSGNDLHVAGFSRPTSNTTASKYWKNTEEFTLSENVYGSAAWEIDVYNNNVFMTIIETGLDNITRSYLWKNGERYMLAGNQEEFAYIKDLTIFNGEVYVCGVVFNSNNNSNRSIKIWENTNEIFSKEYFAQNNLEINDFVIVN